PSSPSSSGLGITGTDVARPLVVKHSSLTLVLVSVSAVLVACGGSNADKSATPTAADLAEGKGGMTIAQVRPPIGNPSDPYTPVMIPGRCWTYHRPRSPTGDYGVCFLKGKVEGFGSGPVPVTTTAS